MQAFATSPLWQAPPYSLPGAGHQQRTWTQAGKAGRGPARGGGGNAADGGIVGEAGGWSSRRAGWPPVCAALQVGEVGRAAPGWNKDPMYAAT